ncbi:MAG: HPP family protein [Novosphingobium sp.]|jgi:CBS domain-containing membrane protein|nr:HPP family protein [Novosphingobium sp.]MBP6555637.1 HPP family protein [Novosphingobium sp.]
MISSKRPLGWLFSTLGATLAIILASLAAQLVSRADPVTPWLSASIGASAVLTFHFPASPLAQPWSVACSHLTAAAIGLTVRHLGLEPSIIAGLAVGGAIAAMKLTRSEHPPAGGTALITALAPVGSAATQWHFLLAPLAVNVAVLLLLAVLWNRLTGHSYPHRAVAVPAPEPWAGHILDEDLDAVLEQWDEALDVDRGDLLALLHAVEARVFERVKLSVGKP